MWSHRRHAKWCHWRHTHWYYRRHVYRSHGRHRLWHHGGYLEPSPLAPLLAEGTLYEQKDTHPAGAVRRRRAGTSGRARGQFATLILEGGLIATYWREASIFAPNLRMSHEPTHPQRLKQELFLTTNIGTWVLLAEQLFQPVNDSLLLLELLLLRLDLPLLFFDSIDQNG